MFVEKLLQMVNRFIVPLVFRQPWSLKALWPFDKVPMAVFFTMVNRAYYHGCLDNHTGSVCTQHGC
jgi:hypothetical protein